MQGNKRDAQRAHAAASRLSHAAGQDLNSVGISKLSSGKAQEAAAKASSSPRVADGRFSHPRMPMSERAKIFVPFNPLKGFSEALRAKEREVEAAALDDRGGNDLEAPDEATTPEEYLTAEDLADGTTAGDLRPSSSRAER